jgi:hypothetical protein
LAPRGSRADHYRAIAGFYGTRVGEDILNPNVPEFVILHDARRAVHYALCALGLEARPRRKAAPRPMGVASWAAGATSDSIPA